MCIDENFGMLYPLNGDDGHDPRLIGYLSSSIDPDEMMWMSNYTVFFS